MPALLSLKEVSERLSLHINTVRKFIDQGLIPIVKFEKAIRVEERDLEKFIRTRKRRVKK
jgi:excisionase family DNA binding protein